MKKVRCKNCKIIETDGAKEVECCAMHAVAEKLLYLVKDGMKPKKEAETEEEFKRWHSDMKETIAQSEGKET
jgi:hypothetical protein